MSETPEQKARREIDADLTAAGWIIQNKEDLDLTAGRGIAVRNFTMKPGFGFADYLLYLDRKAVGCQEPTYAVQKIALAIRSLVGDGPIFVAAALLASVRNSRNGIYGTYLQFSLLRRSPP